MITLFIIGMFLLVIEMIAISMKAAWGLTKILFFVVFFPLILVGMIFIGLIKIAFPILLIILGVSLVKQFLGKGSDY